MFTTYLAKDFAVIILLLVLCYFIIRRNIFKSLITFFIHFFLFNFYVGQGYINKDLIIKYIAKPAFLLIFIFIIFINQYPKKLFTSRFFFIWLCFICVAAFSILAQGRQSIFTIITYSSFFLVYFILQSQNLTIKNRQDILNLFVAIALLQTVISYLQVAQLIPPPTKIMGNGFGGQYEWSAGLDDVASGTFGPAAGFIASWYAAMISLLLLIIWSITKRKIYIILIALSFLQFATTDSKIVTAVTALMIVFTLYLLAKNKRYFNLNLGRYIKMTIILMIGVYGFYKAWDKYYQYYSKETKTNVRVGVKGVMENMVNETSETVTDNIWDWGKIKGFEYLYEDFIKTGTLQLLCGYGLGGYTYNGKMSYIESLDTPVMKLNNATRSRSGLIDLFAKTGLMGFFLCLFALYNWYLYNKVRIFSELDATLVLFVKIFLLFSLVLAFLYSILISSIPITIFSAIVSIFFNFQKRNSTLRKI